MPVNLLDDLETIHPRHEDIDDQHVEVFRRDELEGSRTIAGGMNFEALALEDHLYGRAYRRIVVDDKDTCHS